MLDGSVDSVGPMALRHTVEIATIRLSEAKRTNMLAGHIQFPPTLAPSITAPSKTRFSIPAGGYEKSPNVNCSLIAVMRAYEISNGTMPRLFGLSGSSLHVSPSAFEW